MISFPTSSEDKISAQKVDFHLFRSWEGVSNLKMKWPHVVAFLAVVLPQV
jgi:hypothetical protein